MRSVPWDDSFFPTCSTQSTLPPSPPPPHRGSFLCHSGTRACLLLTACSQRLGWRHFSSCLGSQRGSAAHKTLLPFLQGRGVCVCVCHSFPLSQFALLDLAVSPKSTRPGREKKPRLASKQSKLQGAQSHLSGGLTLGHPAVLLSLLCQSAHAGQTKTRSSRGPSQRQHVPMASPLLPSLPRARFASGA